MSAPILYSFRRCPYAMRARMALHVAGIDYEHREVALRDKPQAMIDASPKATVPVFIDADGGVIDESLAIMQWALAQHDPLGWLAEEDAALIAANDGDFKHHLDRYKYASRYADVARGDVDLSHRQNAERHIQTLETRLSTHSYLLSNTQTLTDIAIFPFIRQFANTQPEWWTEADYPNVRRWLQEHVKSELFITIMKKHALWRPNV